jgi:hypothetical protein
VQTDRFAAYREIENYRGNPLIVYATSTRANVNAMMASDAVRQLIDQIDLIPRGESVDVLLHSTGGDGLAAWKLMSVLRERFTTVTVLVPYMAFSAATLFALGADEIIMHPHSSLGPIDPQVTVTTSEGKQRHFSYEDVGAFIRFLSEEVKITEQIHMSSIIDRLFAAVDPLNVGAAKRASELSTAVGERLLKMHMKDDSGERAKLIAERLNKSFFAHADAVSRRRARDLELSIGKDDKTIERLIWNAFLGLEEYMEMRKPFDPLGHFLSDPTASASVEPGAPLVLPSNTPPSFAQGAWNLALQNAVNGLQAAGSAEQVEYSLVFAVVESVRAASEFYQNGTITAARMATGEFQIFMVSREGGWRDTQVPPVTPSTPQPMIGSA